MICVFGMIEVSLGFRVACQLRGGDTVGDFEVSCILRAGVGGGLMVSAREPYV